MKIAFAIIMLSVCSLLGQSPWTNAVGIPVPGQWFSIFNPQFPTNIASAEITFSFVSGTSYGDYATNADFAFTSPINVSTTNYQTRVVMVTNTAGSGTLTVTMPANCHLTGTANVTNQSTFTFFNSAGRWTNCVALPLW